MVYKTIHIFLITTLNTYALTNLHISTSFFVVVVVVEKHKAIVNDWLLIFDSCRKTYVHRFIVRNTVEDTIHNTISNDETGFWSSRKCTVENLMELFRATDVKNDT